MKKSLLPKLAVIILTIALAMSMLVACDNNGPNGPIEQGAIFDNIEIGEIRTGGAIHNGPSDEPLLVGSLRTTPTAAEAPWGVAGSHRFHIITAPASYYGFSILSGEDTFEMGHSYLIMFNIHMLANNNADEDIAFLWGQVPGQGARTAQKVPMPAVGQWTTIAMTIEALPVDTEVINFFPTVGNNIELAIGNISVVQLEGGTMLPGQNPQFISVSSLNITVDGEDAQMTQIGTDWSFYGLGTNEDGTALVFNGFGRDGRNDTNRTGNDFTGVRGRLPALDVGRYSMTFDLVLLNLLDADTFSIQVGGEFRRDLNAAGNPVLTSTDDIPVHTVLNGGVLISSDDIDGDIVRLRERSITIEFEIVAGASIDYTVFALFGDIIHYDAYQSGFGFAIGNIVINSLQ